MICGDDRFTARVLESADRLKVISKWGTGIDSIDQEACRRIGIAVRNTPNAFSEPVADTVLGYMLMFCAAPARDERPHENGQLGQNPRRLPAGVYAGVIGVGNCGKAVVRRAVPFGMQILGNDIRKTPEGFVEQTGIRMTSKEDLLQQADFVSLNADLNPTSFHLIGADELSRMKPTAVLINAARGPLVDETALIAALQQKMIAGAALDVFEVEPLPTESPLRQMPNVLMAPHNANSSPAAWERIHQSTIDNLLAVLNDGS